MKAACQYVAAPTENPASKLRKLRVLRKSLHTNQRKYCINARSAYLQSIQESKLKILLIVIFPLVASCAPSDDWLTQEEMRAVTNQATAMGYSCATFQVRPNGHVSDLVVGAPRLTSDGPVLCPGGQMFPYELLDDEKFLVNELECGFSGVVDLSKWICVRGVPTRAISPSDLLD